MDELQAAILRVKLADLEYSNNAALSWQTNIASRLSESQILLPVSRPGIEPVYHHFVIRHPRRETLRCYLANQGIATLVHYPMPVHLQKGYFDLGIHSWEFSEIGNGKPRSPEPTLVSRNDY